jgi:hypothetical protein
VNGIKYLLILGLCLNSAAKAAVCLPTPDILDEEVVASFEAVNDKIKEDFKRRPVTLSKYHSLLNIETNFEVPVVGEDTYFGRVYIVDGKPDILKYRDEMIADRQYKNESKDDSFYFSEYKVSDINSPKGLSLIKQAGAEVTMKSTGFTTTKGGRIYLKVKGPGDSPQNLVIDVKISPGKIENFLIIGGQRIAFDSLKINADKSFLTGTSILAGIKSLVFSKNGQTTKTITQ